MSSLLLSIRFLSKIFFSHPLQFDLHSSLYERRSEVEAIEVDRRDLNESIFNRSSPPVVFVCVKFICENKHRTAHFQKQTEGVEENLTRSKRRTIKKEETNHFDTH